MRCAYWPFRAAPSPRPSRGDGRLSGVDAQVKSRRVGQEHGYAASVGTGVTAPPNPRRFVHSKALALADTEHPRLCRPSAHHPLSVRIESLAANSYAGGHGPNKNDGPD
jgi:hypothetical protein